MTSVSRTQEFFRFGGRIFSGETSLLAHHVRALGLVASVTMASTASAGHLKHHGHHVIHHKAAPHPVRDKREPLVHQAVVAPTLQSASSQSLISASMLPPVPADADTMRTGSIKTPSSSDAFLSVSRLINKDIVEQSQTDQIDHRFGDYTISHALLKSIVKAAQDADFPVAYLLGVAEKESGFNPDARPPRGSALGLMQFIDQTWLRVVKENGSRVGLAKESTEIVLTTNGRGAPVYAVDDPKERSRVLDLRRDPYFSAVLAAIDLKAAKLRIEQTLGAQFSDNNLYLPHFLGEDQAKVAMAAFGDRPGAAAPTVFKREARYNPGMFYDKSHGRRRPIDIATFIKRSQDVILNRASKYGDAEKLAMTPVAALIADKCAEKPSPAEAVSGTSLLGRLNGRIAEIKALGLVSRNKFEAPLPLLSPMANDNGDSIPYQMSRL